MVKFSKKNPKNVGQKTKKLSVKRKRSKVMKNAGNKGKSPKLQSNKERTLYCLVCRQKVKVKDYDIREMKNGALQVVATCPRVEHKANKDGKKLVFGFISALYLLSNAPYNSLNNFFIY